MQVFKRTNKVANIIEECPLGVKPQKYQRTKLCKLCNAEYRTAGKCDRYLGKLKRFLHLK